MITSRTFGFGCVVVVLLTRASFLIAAEPVTGGSLARSAVMTGEPAKGELSGQAVVYLHQLFKTDAKVYGEAEVVEVLDDNCARIKLRITMPDYQVKHPNPKNPTEIISNPFESITVAKFCDDYIK